MRLSVERAEMRLPVTLEVLENGLDVKIRFGWELQSFSSQMSSLKWGNGLSCQNQNHLWSRDMAPHTHLRLIAGRSTTRRRLPLFGRTESAGRCSGEPRAPAAVRENRERRPRPARRFERTRRRRQPAPAPPRSPTRCTVSRRRPGPATSCGRAPGNSNGARHIDRPRVQRPGQQAWHIAADLCSNLHDDGCADNDDRRTQRCS